jgi:hypothetical protein
MHAATYRRLRREAEEAEAGYLAAAREEVERVGRRLSALMSRYPGAAKRAVRA